MVSDNILMLDGLDVIDNRFVGYLAEVFRQGGVIVKPLRWDRVGVDPVDRIVIQWPDDFLRKTPIRVLRRVVTRLARLYLSKRRFDTKIVWIVHNIRPHQSRSGQLGYLERSFLRAIDYIVHLSEYSSSLFVEEFGRLEHAIPITTVHGKYTSENAVVRPNAQMVSNILFFGMVRPYKNIETLISQFCELNEEHLILTIMGKQDNRIYGDQLRVLSDVCECINLKLSEKSVSDRDLDQAIDDCDVVILPYKKILNSGAAINALSRFRPVLAPRLGSLKEVQRLVGSDWLHLYEGDLTSEVIASFLLSINKIDLSSPPNLEGLSWKRVAQDILPIIKQ